MRYQLRGIDYLMVFHDRQVPNAAQEAKGVEQLCHGILGSS